MPITPLNTPVITIGRVNNEDWVSTNCDGTGRLLFKLKDAELIYEELKTLRELCRLKENECDALRAEIKRLAAQR